MSGKIIDIAEFQNITDYSKMLAASKFIFIRIQSGSSYKDTKAAENIKQVSKSNVPYAVYAFARYVSAADAKVEAQDLYNRTQQYIKACGGKQPVAYVLDKENDPTYWSVDDVASQQAFLDEIKRLSGKPTIFYTGTWLYNAKGYGKVKADYRWIADYNKKPVIAETVDCWQSQSDGRIDGISGNVDISVSLTKRFDSLIAGSGSSSKPTPKPTPSATVKLPSGVTKEHGVFTAGTTLRVWTKPGIGDTGVTYKKGESVIYQGYIRSGNYIYAAYQTNKGDWRYIAVRENGVALGTFK